MREFHELPGRTPSPPAAAAAATPDRGGWMRRMFVALLDPRSIQWLLTLGGGLMVLGALIWLISKGVLEDPLVLAVVLGAVSLGVLLGGWYVTLKTRFQIAGRALTFLGCVVAPLNLWFYHVQGLSLLEHGLWVGGLACVALYAATVWALRDGLFMYAVEAGITLTAVLLLGSFGLADHATHLCILLTALALVSIHAPQLFSANAETFTRKRFGMPLFWCGHAQLGAALVILAVTQVAGWLPPLGDLFDLPPQGILITTSHLAPALLWLAGAYAYLYSDLAVRRIGVYTYLAAVCLVLAEVTFAGLELLGVDGLVATLAVTATAVSLLARLLRPDQEGVTRAIAPLALVLSFVPVGIGLLVHLRATSEVALEVRIDTETTWTFLAAMLTVAVANRISAFLYQAKSRSLAAVYFFFSALALLMAAAGLLRMLDLSTWQQQAPVLMLM